MPILVWVIFTDQNRNPWKLVGYNENANNIRKIDTNAQGLQFT